MFLKLCAVALPLFIALDLTWIGFVAKNLYQNQIGFLLKTQVNWPAVVSFYLVYITGLVFFVIHPSIQKNSWSMALLHGALFGLVTYATYDLTNLATTKNWPLPITLIDLAWGTFIAATVSVLTVLIAQKIS